MVYLINCSSFKHYMHVFFNESIVADQKCPDIAIIVIVLEEVIWE